MEFYLKYDGKLKPNGNSVDKQAVRDYFRPQMEQLWKTMPLNSRKDLLVFPPEKGKTTIIKEVATMQFAPLVTTAVDLTCELDITLLWQDRSGKMINRGDIDNRLKTLFDALSCPSKQQISDKAELEKHQPYHTLLEDDCLITAVKVQTNRLLVERPSNDISVLIKVTTKPYRSSWANTGL